MTFSAEYRARQKAVMDFRLDAHPSQHATPTSQSSHVFVDIRAQLQGDLHLVVPSNFAVMAVVHTMSGLQLDRHRVHTRINVVDVIVR